jgi:hypothetical protein
MRGLQENRKEEVILNFRAIKCNGDSNALLLLSDVAVFSIPLPAVAEDPPPSHSRDLQSEAESGVRIVPVQ